MADKKSLTRDWITYLKNNQIVELQSDPKTGKLTYKRPVTVADLRAFLDSRDDINDEVADQAITSVATPREPGERAFGQMANHLSGSNSAPSSTGGTTSQTPTGKVHTANPNNPNKQQAPGSGWPSGPAPTAPVANTQAPAPAPKPRGGKVSGQVSQTPNAIRKRNARAAKRINEELEDEDNTEISERDVEGVFNQLVNAVAEPVAQDPVSNLQGKEEELRKLKRLIRDQMNDQQRQSLWRALNNA